MKTCKDAIKKSYKENPQDEEDPDVDDSPSPEVESSAYQPSGDTNADSTVQPNHRQMRTKGARVADDGDEDTLPTAQDARAFETPEARGLAPDRDALNSPTPAERPARAGALNGLAQKLSMMFKNRIA